MTSLRGTCFFFQAEDGIRDTSVTGVQTCALPICSVGSEAGVAKLQISRGPRFSLTSDCVSLRGAGKSARGLDALQDAGARRLDSGQLRGAELEDAIESLGDGVRKRSRGRRSTIGP